MSCVVLTTMLLFHLTFSICACPSDSGMAPPPQPATENAPWCGEAGPRATPDAQTRASWKSKAAEKRHTNTETPRHREAVELRRCGLCKCFLTYIAKRSSCADAKRCLRQQARRTVFVRRRRPRLPGSLGIDAERTLLVPVEVCEPVQERGGVGRHHTEIAQR